jgi:hypothetical protein
MVIWLAQPVIVIAKWWLSNITCKYCAIMFRPDQAHAKWQHLGNRRFNYVELDIVIFVKGHNLLISHSVQIFVTKMRRMAKKGFAERVNIQRAEVKRAA